MQEQEIGLVQNPRGWGILLRWTLKCQLCKKIFRVSFRKKKEACGVYYSVGNILLRVLVDLKQMKFKAEDQNALESQSQNSPGLKGPQGS